MRKIALGALVLVIVPMSATAHADAPTVPAITKITLGVGGIVLAPSTPCADIPVTIDYALNGNYVYQIDVNVTRGTLPPASSPPYLQLVPATTTSTAVSGTIHYCASNHDVGKLDVGPNVIHYATPTEIGQSTADDPATAALYVRQASTASLHAQRHKKTVTLTARETFYSHGGSEQIRTTSQKAYFEFLKNNNKWKAFASRKPSKATGSASYKVISRHPHNYRVIFAQSNAIAASVSDIINK